MKVSATTIVAAAVLAIGMSAAPANAQGLLGGLLGGGGSGDGLLGGVVDIDSGSAGNDSLVNVGLGNDGGNNNIADIKLGNGGNDGSSTARVRVRGGNGQGGLLNNGGLLGTGLLDGDDDGGVLGSGILGSNLTAGLDLGGLRLDLNVPGIGGLLGGGGNGGNGGNGADGRVLVGSIGSGSYQINCSVNDGRTALQLASQTRLNPRAWARAANVQIVPLKLCPQARAQVAQIFNASGKVRDVQRAAAGDALIIASLSRTRYDAGDVFAVQASGGNLVVYVF